MCFHATVAINKNIPRAWCLDSEARMLRYRFREKFCLKGLQDEVFEKLISVTTSDLHMTSFTFTSKDTDIHTNTHMYTFTVEYTHTDSPSQVRIHRYISSQMNIHIKTHVIHTRGKIIFLMYRTIKQN